MSNNDATKTDNSPQSTWGATEAAKQTWENKHGKAARKAAEEAAAKDAAKDDK